MDPIPKDSNVVKNGTTNILSYFSGVFANMKGKFLPASNSRDGNKEKSTTSTGIAHTFESCVSKMRDLKENCVKHEDAEDTSDVNTTDPFKGKGNTKNHPLLVMAEPKEETDMSVELPVPKEMTRHDLFSSSEIVSAQIEPIPSQLKEDVEISTQYRDIEIETRSVIDGNVPKSKPLLIKNENEVTKIVSSPTVTHLKTRRSKVDWGLIKNMYNQNITLNRAGKSLVSIVNGSITNPLQPDLAFTNWKNFERLNCKLYAGIYFRDSKMVKNIEAHNVEEKESNKYEKCAKDDFQTLEKRCGRKVKSASSCHRCERQSSRDRTKSSRTIFTIVLPDFSYHHT